jgi:hypothetical protein
MAGTKCLRVRSSAPRQRTGVRVSLVYSLIREDLLMQRTQSTRVSTTWFVDSPMNGSASRACSDRAAAPRSA